MLYEILSFNGKQGANKLLAFWEPPYINPMDLMYENDFTDPDKDTDLAEPLKLSLVIWSILIFGGSYANVGINNWKKKKKSTVYLYPSPWDLMT